MNPEILEAVFPVKSEWLALQLDGPQAPAPVLNLRLVCWEWDDQAKARTVWEIYTQETRLLPEDAVEPNQERVENYLLALGLCLERIFLNYDASLAFEANGRVNILDVMLALRLGFGQNHPLLLAKAQTVEDFTKALETKGRLGKWL